MIVTINVTGDVPNLVIQRIIAAWDDASDARMDVQQDDANITTYRVAFAPWSQRTEEDIRVEIEHIQGASLVFDHEATTLQ